MKIVDVRTTLISKEFKNTISDAARHIPCRDVILVEIDTDEGITGVGFLTGLGTAFRSECAVVKYVIDRSLKPMLLGKDPLAREHLWAYMYKNTTRFGMKGAVVRGISGVDIALWDLAGKITSLPVYKLIGYDKVEVPVYASGGFYAGEGDDLQPLIEELQSYMDVGYRAVKMKVGSRDVREDISRVEAVRKIIGSEVSIMVDANEGWNVIDAIRFCEGTKDLNLFWLEEPLTPDDLTGYATLSKATNLPIASGESEYTKYGFKNLILNGVRFIQPDVTRVGGITEWLKATQLAESWNLPSVPHAVQEIHVTCVACAHNSPFTEYFTADHPLQELISELFVEQKTAMTVIDGKIRPPEIPGLGLKYDPKVVEFYKIDD